jgi:hypothetical protein
MKQLVAITDLTRMQEQRVCLAGYLPDYTCIRPIIPRSGLTEVWLQATRRAVIRPFCVVAFELVEHTPEPPHTEDWTISPVYQVVRMVKSKLALLQKIEDKSVESIFGAEITHEQGWYVRAGEGERSLGTVVPGRIDEVSYKLVKGSTWDYRISFTDEMDKQYRLAVTDLAFRYYLDNQRMRQGVSPDRAARRLYDTLTEAQVFLRIGLARHWEKHPDRCHLQITGVHTFPDYLEGKCFADLAPYAGTRTGPAEDIEVPF